MHRTSSPMLTLCSSLGQMGSTQPRQEKGAGPVQHGPHTSAWLQMAAQTTGICMTFGGNTDNNTSLSFSRAMGRHTHGPLQQYRPRRHQSPRWQSRSLTSFCSSPLFVSSSNRFHSTATTLRLPLSLLSTAHLPPQCGAHLTSRAWLPTRPVTSGCFLPTEMKISV